VISGIALGQEGSHAEQDQPKTSPPKTPPDSFLRLARSWVLLPIIAYLLSFPCLGAGALFVPIVIMNAPLGIIGCFEPITVNATPDQQTTMAAIHGAFWMLFIVGLSLRRWLPLGWLWPIWLILVTALFMSVSGCASQLGPGLRNDGNWH
jgi:hypothetical protein